MTSIIFAAFLLLSVFDASLGDFELIPPDTRGMLACFQTLDDQTRTTIVNSFNNIRSQIAKGKFVAYNGKLAPPGKNMNKVKYDYILEALLQVYLANPPNERIIPSYADFVGTAFIDVSVVKALTMSPGNMFYSTYTQNGTGVYGGTQFAFSDATSVACAYNAYPSDYPNGIKTLCAVAPIPSSYSNPTYTVGSACTKDSECTKPGFNKCDAALGLCYP